MPTPLMPCPQYKAGEPCPRREDCPVARYVTYAKCDSLTANGVKIVEMWIADK